MVSPSSRRTGSAPGKGAPCAAFLGALSVVLALVACGGTRGTIGAMLGQRPDGRLFVRETPDHLAARTAGLAPGDEVLLIDGKDVRTMDARELHRALGGDEGTRVKLTLVRQNDVVRVTVIRGQPGRRGAAPRTE